MDQGEACGYGWATLESPQGTQDLLVVENHEIAASWIGHGRQQRAVGHQGLISNLALVQPVPVR